MNFARPTNEAGFEPKIELTYEVLLKQYRTTSDVVDEKNYLKALEALRVADAIQVGRGKFLFAVLISLLDFLRSDSRRTKPRVFACRQPCKIDDSDLPMATLSTFADTPPELTIFLRRLRVVFGLDPAVAPAE